MNEAQYRWLTSTVGQVAREDADARYERLGTPKAVALELLREKRAATISGFSSVSLPGGLSVNQSENIKALERLIVDVTAGPDDPTAAPVPDDVVEPLAVTRLRSRWRRGGRPRWATRW